MVGNNKPRILVVDDEEDLLNVFKDLFSQRGENIDTVRSGEKAVEKLQNGSYEVVISDINLPGINGLEVLRVAKKENPNACVIMITGFASASSAITALREGAYDYITKPFDLWEVSQIVDRGIEAHRLAAENKRLLQDLKEANASLQSQEEHLKEEVKKATRRLSTLYEIGMEVSSSLNLKRTLVLIVERAKQLMQARACLLFLADDDGEKFAGEVGAGIEGDRLHGMTIKIGEGIVGGVAQAAKPIICADLEVNGRDEKEPLRAVGAKEALVVPLIHKGCVIGTLAAIDKRDEGFMPSDQDLLMLFGSQAAIAISNAQLFEKTRELDRLKSEFVAVVSHEIRTPLTSIKGSLELLSDEKFFPLTDSQKELLFICHANTDRLIFLINDILDFSRIESSKLTMTFRPFNVGSTIRDSVKGIRRLAEQGSIVVKTMIPQKDLIMYGDEFRIGQVITNLLSNAVKFSEPGGEILVSASTKDSSVQVCVQDSGKGIATEDVPKLFHKFQQLDSSPTRKAGGTGLGLVICKGIVEQHGGKIWLDSTPGVGSKFYFTIPKAKAVEVVGEKTETAAKAG
jgi:signal transduction histidine kinase/DNA-binding response OmpR family regulator